MKAGASLILASVLLAGCEESPAAANDTAIGQQGPARTTTGQAQIDALVTDLAAGRRDAALARLYGITTITGNPNAVPTVGALVDKLMTCTFLSGAPFGRRDFLLYRVLWRCPEGDYEALIDAEGFPPRLLIGQFQRAGAAEQMRSTPPPAPPPGMPRP